MASKPDYGETLLGEEERDALTAEARELLGDPVRKADLPHPVFMRGDRSDDAEIVQRGRTQGVDDGAQVRDGLAGGLLGAGEETRGSPLSTVSWVRTASRLSPMLVKSGPRPS